jgi:hypothetical protein
MHASEAAQEFEKGAPGHRALVEVFRRAGARALVFYLRDGREGAKKKVRVERLNPDGQTYRVLDIQTREEIFKAVLPVKLTVGLGTRTEDDPVIKIMQELQIDHHPFLNSLLNRPESVAREFRTPLSHQEAFEPLRRSAPPILFPETRETARPFLPNNTGAFRRGTPSPSGMHAGREGLFRMGGRGFGPFKPGMQATRPTPLAPLRPLGGHFRSPEGLMGAPMAEQRRRRVEPVLGDEHQREGSKENWEAFDQDFWNERRRRADWDRRNDQEN